MSWIAKVAAAVGDSIKSKGENVTAMQKPPSDTAFIELPQMPWRRKKKETPLVLETAPFDPRFPNMNQTRYCYQSYLDYHRCRKVKGENYKPCEYFYKCYKSLCPIAWVEKWDDQLESGTFPGRI